MLCSQLLGTNKECGLSIEMQYPGLWGSPETLQKLKIEQQLMEISLSRISDVEKCVLAAEIKCACSSDPN